MPNLFGNNNELINYESITNNHPWVIEQNKNCILSPDSDGFMCALLMTNILNWNVVGYYDGKIMILKDGYNYSDCIFLDMDINRNGIKSVGHHMVQYNKRLNVTNFNYKDCIQPNIIRNFDGKNDFQRKYPFGTIHLLYGILQNSGLISSIPDNSIIPLLFINGVFNNLLGYPENCLDWIKYLRIENSDHILHPLFFHETHNLYDIMTGLNEFFEVRDSFNASGFLDGNEYKLGGRNIRTGHQLKISDTSGYPINLEPSGNNLYNIHGIEKTRVSGFISRIGEYSDLHYDETKWEWNNFNVTVLNKSILGGGSNYGNLNNQTYLGIMNRNPFSLAMTSSNQIEYAIQKTTN